MDETTIVVCPYCFESIEVYVEPDTIGELVRDCDVCCRPWSVRVSRNVEGALFVDAEHA